MAPSHSRGAVVSRCIQALGCLLWVWTTTSLQRDGHPLVSRPNLRYFETVIYDASLDELLHAVWDGQRISQVEARRLYDLPLEELGALADRRRQLACAAAYDGRGNQVVTYIVDRNINYTNVCNVYCKFCAFYRTEKDNDAYVITLSELDRKIEETLEYPGQIRVTVLRETRAVDYAK